MVLALIQQWANGAIDEVVDFPSNAEWVLGESDASELQVGLVGPPLTGPVSAGDGPSAALSKRRIWDTSADGGVDGTPSAERGDVRASKISFICAEWPGKVCDRIRGEAWNLF